MYDYRGLVSEHYDLNYASYSPDIEFYVDMAEAAGSPVLELGCGTGRITFPIAEKGVDIVGLDVSTEMLAIAAKKAEELSDSTRQRISWVHGDMSTFDLGRQFNLVIIPFRAFLHLLTVEDEMSALACIWRHLADGGRLVFNVFDPRLDIISEHLSSLGPAIKKHNDFVLDNGRRMVVWESRRYAPETQRLDHDMIYEELDADGVVISRRHEQLTLRYIYRWEMAHMLARCGFEVQALYGDFDRGPFRYGGEQIWVAQKGETTAPAGAQRRGQQQSDHLSASGDDLPASAVAASEEHRVRSPKILPEWAPRLPQWKIRRLYETDANGIYDQELIEDVGYGLLSRCKSFVAAVEATRGRAVCPLCGALVEHSGDKEQMLRCDCGWELSWWSYFTTIQHKQLSGADPVLALFQDYVDRFPHADSPRAQMLLIDELIHGFHWFYKTNTPTRPVAVNLIEGRLGQVMDFLDELTYGAGSTPGTVETKAQWDVRIQTARSWPINRA